MSSERRVIRLVILLCNMYIIEIPGTALGRDHAGEQNKVLKTRRGNWDYKK